jgi:hypothetical protein
MVKSSQVVDVTNKIDILCPNGQTYYQSSSGGSLPVQVQALAIGSPCTATFYANVQTGPMTPNGTRNASWDSPPGTVVTRSTNNTVIAVGSQAPGYLSGVQPGLYTHLAFAVYRYPGRWDGTSCTNGGWTQCGHTIRPEGLGTSVFDPCIFETSYAPNPPDCTSACQQPVAQLITDLFGQTHSHIVAGNLQTWPQPAQPPRVGPVVNLPIQFYIPDWTFNDTQQSLIRQELILIGPPDDLGRSRVFTFLVTVGLEAIDWDFGDGTGAHFSDASGFGQNIFPPAGSSTVNHAYTRINDPTPYRVTATETWGARVDEYWIGGHTEVTNLERTAQVITSADLSVGQVEPIPCSGTGSG